MDLGASPVGRHEHLVAPLPLARASGSVELTADRPVASIPLNVTASIAPGTTTPAPYVGITAAVKRLTEAPAGGLDAPPPIRATLLDGAGEVLGAQGFPAGSSRDEVVVPLPGCSPACPGEYYLALEWMDRRVAAHYDVTWTAELRSVPTRDAAALPVVLVADRAVLPAPAFVGRARFAHTRAGGDRTSVRIESERGGRQVLPPATHLRSVFTVSVEGEASSDFAVVRLRLSTAEGSLEPPDAIPPGGSATLALNADELCGSGSCVNWRVESYVADRRQATYGQGNQRLPGAGPLRINWNVEARAYPLLPTTERLPLRLMVEGAAPSP